MTSYPAAQAAAVAVRTVRETLKGMKPQIEVTFCCFSRQDHQIYKARLKQAAAGSPS